MRKRGVVLAAIVLAAGVAACSDSLSIHYNFAGRWNYEERQQSSNCRLNIAALGALLITQNDKQVEVMVAPVGQDGGHAYGACDPSARTISFNWANALGGTSIMKAVAVDETTLTGTSYHTSTDGCFANTTWTATLAGR